MAAESTKPGKLNRRKPMADRQKGAFSTTQLAMLLDHIPVGITVIDPQGIILYYNEYCSRLVDRKPEYIGRDIRFCHQQPRSIEKIDRVQAELRAGKREEFYYETERNGRKLGVTVSPFKIEGELAGFIHSFVIIR